MKSTNLVSSEDESEDEEELSEEDEEEETQPPSKKAKTEDSKVTNPSAAPHDTLKSPKKIPHQNGNPTLDSELPKDKNWSKDETLLLLNNLTSAIPDPDALRFQTQLVKIDWQQVAFHPYTAKECNTKWAAILKNVRQFRTLSEVVGDAVDAAKKLPDALMPVKPLDPMNQFIVYAKERMKNNLEVDCIIRQMLNG
jgi:hypothetical protein